MQRTSAGFAALTLLAACATPSPQSGAPLAQTGLPSPEAQDAGPTGSSTPASTAAAGAHAEPALDAAVGSGSASDLNPFAAGGTQYESATGLMWHFFKSYL